MLRRTTVITLVGTILAQHLLTRAACGCIFLAGNPLTYGADYMAIFADKTGAD